MLLIYVFTILHFLLFQSICFLLIKEKSLLQNSMLCYTGSNLKHPVFTTSLDGIIFSCVRFNLLLFCTVTCCRNLSLGAIGCTIQSRCVVGFIIQVWVRVLYDVCTVLSPNDTFFRRYPYRKVVRDCMYFIFLRGIFLPLYCIYFKFHYFSVCFDLLKCLAIFGCLLMVQ